MVHLTWVQCGRDVKQGCMQKQGVVFLGLGLVYLKSLAQVKSHVEEKGIKLSPRVFKSQSAEIPDMF